MVLFKSALGICLALIFCTLDVKASLRTYKILGGYIGIYQNEQATHFIRRDSEWGVTHGSNRITVGEGYCRDDEDNYRRRYCQQRLFVSTSENQDIEHYEFKGSYFERMDAERERMDEVTYENPPTLAEPPYVDITVFHGESWSDEYNEWGYGFLHYILEPDATRVPIVDAFSWIPYKKSDRNRYEPEVVVGDRSSTSRKRQLSDFRCHSDSFGSSTTCHQYLWTAQTTVVDYKYNGSYERMATSPRHETVLDSVVLENYGHGIGGTNLARVGSKETNTVQSSATFKGNFKVHVDTSMEMNFGISSGDSYFGMVYSAEAGAEFSFEGDITRTATSLSSKEISWPSDCPLGIRKSVALIEEIEKFNVPVEFTLERAGSTWTEENSLEVTLKSVVIRSTACCLYRDASEDCGTDYTPMCDPDAPGAKTDAPVAQTDATETYGGSK